MEENETEEEGDEEGIEGGCGFNGVNGLNGRGSGLFVAGGFGLGGLVVEGGGGAVGVLYLLAVGGGGEARSVAVIVGLDEDGGGLTDGVVEGKGDGLYHSVVDGFIVGLMRDGSAASATHCKQGKRRYEGSR